MTAFKINTFLMQMYRNNKKLPIYLIVLVALGAVALMLGRFTNDPGTNDAGLSNILINNDPPHVAEVDLWYDPPATTDFVAERALEKRLEEFFQMVEGAGRVRVLVSPMTGAETVFAIDVNESRSYSNEEDAQGGTRETRQHSLQEQTVMVSDRAGADRPLVLREVNASVSGVVIIAEGGDSPFVRDALTRAARAVLGLEPHLIQVLTMKGE